MPIALSVLVVLTLTSARVVEEPAEDASAWAQADRLAGEGRHADAAAAYARAWEEEGAVAILYSWAQAERLGGRCDRALDLYARFLDAAVVPPPEYEAEVMRARWSDMRANAERQLLACRESLAEPEPEPEPEPGPEPEPEPQATAPGPTPRPAAADARHVASDRDRASSTPWWRDALGWSLVGIGTASVAAGGTLVGVAAWRDDRAEGRDTHQAFNEAIDRAVLEQRIGIGLLAAGGAFTIAGAVRLGVVARRRGDRRAATTPHIGLGLGTSLGVSGRF